MAIDDWAAGAAARAPDSPIHWRPPQRCAGSLGPGVAIANAGVNGQVINVLGSGRIRIVAKYGQAGTLAAKWRLADHKTNQATNQPATVPLVANTEAILDILINPGYAYLEVSITDTGGGAAIAYVDVVQTAEAN